MNKAFRLCVLSISIVFIVIGILLGDEHTVLKKAVAICLECIGIG